MRTLANALLILLIPVSGLASEARYENIFLTIPDAWSIRNSIIENEKGEKVGEFMPKYAFETDAPIKSGGDFIQAIKNGLGEDESFIESGSQGNVYWACTSLMAYSGRGDPIRWFPRAFWVNGLIVILYSKVSCKDNFERDLKIAKSMHKK